MAASTSSGPTKRRRSGTPVIRITGPTQRFKPRMVPASSVLKPELKFFDTTQTTTAMAAAGTVSSASLNLMTEGSGQSQMLGRRVLVKKLSIRGRIELAEETDATLSNVPGATNYRLVILQDKQANGAAPTIAGAFSNADINTFNNLDNSGRFRVLREIEGVLHASPVAGTTFTHGRAIAHFKDTIKLNVPISFTPEGTPGTRVIGEVTSNNLWIAAFSTGNDLAVTTWRVRIRFLDQ